MRFLMLILVSIFSVSLAHSVQLNFPKVTRVGELKQKVVYASPKYKVKKTSLETKAYVKMIAQWGLHVFEVGVTEFQCNRYGNCRYNQWISLAFYEKCTFGGKQARCQRRLGGGANTGSLDSITRNIVSYYEGELQRDSNSFGDYDFPERGNDYWEYSGVLF